MSMGQGMLGLLALKRASKLGLRLLERGSWKKSFNSEQQDLQDWHDDLAET